MRERVRESERELVLRKTTLERMKETEEVHGV